MQKAMDKFITIDFLDKALLFIREKRVFTPSQKIWEEFSEQENKILVRAMYKLEKDGYVYTQPARFTAHGASVNESTTFFISFDGLLALENTPFISRNKPYKWKRIKGIINTIWEIAKIIMIVLNALAIIYFSYLTSKK